MTKAREVAECGLWSLLTRAGEGEGEEGDREVEEEKREAEERPAKRRKGMAEALLSTAVDAALFTGAVGCERSSSSV